MQEDVNDGGYEYWPVTREDLDPHYDRVEAMIGLQRYPFEHEPYSRTPKTNAFKYAAEKNGLEWFLPPLAVTFANEGRPPVPGETIVEKVPNLHGRQRVTCQLCGECDVGCNFGAKNTLDYNYLTHAKHQGAEIRTLCDVRTIEPREGGGYQVGYADLAAEDGPASRNGRPAPLTTLTCDRLVLSAGTLGTTNLLLRNRSAFPRISRKLGTRFCGNGDLLTLALNCDEEVDGKRVPRIVDPGYGPVITSTARVPDALDGGEGRGFYLQDAGYPQHLAWILHVLAAPQTLWHWRDHGWYLVKNWLRGSPDTDVTGHIADLLESAELSAGGLPLLGMGRDVPDGRMFLRKGSLDLDWKTEKSNAYFERLRTTSRGVAHSLGGRFADNPIWFLRRVITVHPLGGAPMGRFAERGRGRPVRERVRLSRACTSPTARSCPGPSARTPASRSPRSPTASPTASSRPPPPRRPPPHDRQRPLHRGDARPRHVRGGGLPARRRAGARRRRGAEVPPHDRGRRHRPLRLATRGAAPARTATWCATRSAAGCRSSTAPSTCSSTPSRASSTCSTGSSSATAPATR